jgi:tetratricopeptide (TPR) repeat protein
VVVKISNLAGGTEAQTLGPLQHVNVMPIHSVRREPGTGLTAICMPYLGAATLDHLIDRAHLPVKNRGDGALVVRVAQELLPAEVPIKSGPVDPFLPRATRFEALLHVGAQLADALAFLHDNKVSHGDLKPSNVLLGPDGRPRLLDFNLAAGEGSANKHFGGTVPYMAPEQVQCALDEQPPAVELGPRSDLFSLGVVLYELLTGQNPFGSLPVNLELEEAGPLLLERQRRGPQPLRQWCPEAGGQLEQLLARCLAFTPADRPASAHEVAVALRRLLAPLARLGRRPGWIMGLVLAIAASCFGAVYAVANRPASPAGLYAQGLRAYQEKNYVKAQTRFDEAVRLDPKNFQALFARGRARQQLSEHGLALADFVSIEKEFRDGRLLACMGYAFNRSGQHLSAAAYYSQANRWEYTSAPLSNNQGYSELMSPKPKLDRAEQEFAHALELDPRLQAAYHNRAMLHYKRSFQAPSKDPDSVFGPVGAVGMLNPLPGAGPWPGVLLASSTSSQLAIQYIERALVCGDKSLELCYDAAGCWAKVAPYDPHGKNRALDYMQQALVLGKDPQRFLNDSVFRLLQNEPRFGALLRQNHPILPQEARTCRLLDPVDAIPELRTRPSLPGFRAVVEK